MKGIKQTTHSFLMICVLVFTTLWFVERWIFENILEKMISRAAENGIKISYVSATASGYPDDLVFRLKSVNITFKDFFEINMPVVDIRAGLFFPLKQQFQINFGSIQGVLFKNFTFTAFQVQAAFFLKKMRTQSIRFFADSLVAIRSQTPIPDVRPFVAIRDQTPAIEMRPFHLHLIGEHEGEVPILHLNFYSRMKRWFKKTSWDAVVDTNASLSISHYKVLLNTPYPFQAWRDKGGKMTIKKYQVRGRQLDLYGEGVLFLDENLFPQGNIFLKIQGVAPFVRFLRKRFNLSFEQALLLQAGLSALHEKDSEGYVAAPLYFENGKMFFGNIPLLPLFNLQ